MEFVHCIMYVVGVGGSAQRQRVELRRVGSEAEARKEAQAACCMLFSNSEPSSPMNNSGNGKDAAVQISVAQRPRLVPRVRLIFRRPTPLATQRVSSYASSSERRGLVFSRSKSIPEASLGLGSRSSVFGARRRSNTVHEVDRHRGPVRVEHRGFGRKWGTFYK